MDILILIHSLASGGAERVTANLANYWAANGWRVTVATLDWEGSDFYALNSRVERVQLGLANESSNAIAAVTANIQRIAAIRTLLKAGKPDIALGMMNATAVLLSAAAIGLPCRTIGYECSHPPVAPIRRCWSYLRRYGYGLLDAVVAFTSEAADWLRQNTKAQRVAVIPIAVVWPLPKYSPEVDPKKVGDPSRKRLLAVGRLARVKGFDMLLESFSRVTARHSDWELVIVGDGPERAALQSQIETSGLVGRAILAGQAGNISDWYWSSHLLAMSSRHEGFPNVLIEAMAHGLPVVSFDCEAGPHNIVRNDVDGLLVPAADVGALAEGLDRVMSDTDLRNRFSSRAVDVHERFSETRIQDMYRQLFDEVLTPSRV